MSNKTPRVLFDSSVLIPALVEMHPHHSRTAPRLEQAHTDEIHLVISTHAIAEVYSTLTALPISPRISPADARRLVRDNILSRAEVVTLDRAEYEEVLDRMASLGLTGGVVYDALHIRAAQKAKVDRLWTVNLRDFERIWPDHGGTLEGL